MTREPSTTRRGLVAGGSVLAVGLAGCATTPPSAGRPPEATATVRLTNRDAVERAYEVVVRGSDTVTDSFSGVLPADTDQPVEMVATFRVGDGPAEFHVETEGGRVGRTWDPLDCPEFGVDAVVEDGMPAFEAGCEASATGSESDE